MNTSRVLFWAVLTLFCTAPGVMQGQTVTICNEYTPEPGVSSCVCYSIQTLYDFYGPDCNTPTLKFRFRFRFGDGRTTAWEDIWVADNQYPDLVDPSPKFCFNLDDCPIYMDFEYLPGSQYCWYMVVPQLTLISEGPCGPNDPTE